MRIVLDKLNSQPVLHSHFDLGNNLINIVGGNVGIGTTSPATALDVNGNITIGGNRILFTDNGIQNYGGMGVRNSANSAWGEWRASAFIAGDLVRYDGGNIQTADTDNFTFRFKARTNGGSQTEVASLQAAADPYFKAGSAVFLYSGNVGIGIAAPLAQAHIDQSSTTGAKPVITVDQADVDEDFFKFIGTSDTSADRALVDAVDFSTPGAIKGWLKINIQDDQATNPIVDGDYYVPFYAAPTA